MIIALAMAVVAQLDAPVTQQPTVRSEIKNGFDTGAACDQYDMSASAVDPCFARLITAYRLNHASYQAFTLGLNLRKWKAGYKFVQIADGLPGNSLAQDYATYGKISAGQAEIEARDATEALKITMDDAFTAADVIPANRPESVFKH